jgi:hypothetical protein
MAVWLYQSHRIKLPADGLEDEKLMKVLEDFGKQGWELVQVLPEHEVAEVGSYWLILKAEKELI